MPEYTVISRRILTGTISDLPYPARIAWMTIIFEAQKLGGKVKLPVRDLARMANITTPEAAEALRIFQQPDEFSSSKAEDGKRLVAIDGEEDWYNVVTWDKHAEERELFFNRLRQQRHTAKKRASQQLTVGNGDERSLTAANERTRTRTRTGKEESNFNISSAFEEIWKSYPSKAGKEAAERHFRASVKSEADLAAVRRALDAYKASKRVKEGFVQDGSRWFKGWRDWLDAEVPTDEPVGFPAANCRCGHADYYHDELTGPCAIRRDNHNAEDCQCLRFNGNANV